MSHRLVYIFKTRDLSHKLDIMYNWSLNLKVIIQRVKIIYSEYSRIKTHDL